MITYVLTKSCKQTLIAVLFITAPKLEKKTECLSMDKWINILWWIITKEYYSATKKK